MADSGQRIAARKNVSVVLCHATVDEAKSRLVKVVDGTIIGSDIWGEGKGEWNGRFHNRGKLGRVVHSSYDHRRRTVGHRPLIGDE
jgi:hypothetical protein